MAWSICDTSLIENCPLLQEVDLDSNPPTEGTWDYDHMDVSVTAETDDTQNPDPPQDGPDVKQVSPSAPPKFLSKQTSEDREVAKFTRQNSDLLATPVLLSDTNSCLLYTSPSPRD